MPNVIGPAQAINSSVTNFGAEGNIFAGCSRKIDAYSCPADSLPIEKFDQIMPRSADTDGNNCLHVNEFIEELNRLNIESLGLLRRYYYTCKPFDAQLATRTAKILFSHTYDLWIDGYNVFYTNGIAIPIAQNVANLEKNIGESIGTLQRIAKTGGAGIGILFGGSGKIYGVHEGYSAKEAGIRAGDYITTINGVKFEDIPDAMYELVGDCGQEVLIGIYRPFVVFGFDLAETSLMEFFKVPKENYGYQNYSVTRRW